MAVLLISAPAQSEHAPDSIGSVIVVNSETLIDLVVEHDAVVLVDARLPGDFVRGHIDGAVNLPNTETDCLSLSVVAPSISKSIVFYCNGESCMRSAQSINIARSCGYEKVYWFRGGFEEWVAKGYPYLKK